MLTAQAVKADAARRGLTPPEPLTELRRGQHRSTAYERWMVSEYGRRSDFDPDWG
ncbi:hypothetical protein ID875_21445 [Streptomyces globisporus]|uniref:Uncharacterized protein n=1 Tax=Streptomyces globisporus TaxID=1908 RepID=A0A927BMF1_STRGL|nr:hypothetical protein [Streptomyces globisporus]